MKSPRQIIVKSIVIGFGLFNYLSALNQEQKNAEAVIWELEERYWNCWIEEDIVGLLSMEAGFFSFYNKANYD